MEIQSPTYSKEEICSIDKIVELFITPIFHLGSKYDNTSVESQLYANFFHIEKKVKYENKYQLEYYIRKKQTSALQFVKHSITKDGLFLKLKKRCKNVINNLHHG